VLARLAYQGVTLDQSKVELSGVRANYLKLTWEGQSSFVVQGVRGEFVSGTTEALPRTWTKVSGVRKEGGPQGELMFATGGVFPVDQIRIPLAETNLFVRVALLSSDRIDGQWRERYTGTVYRVSVEGRELVSPPIELGGSVPDRFWLLKSEGSSGRPLALELGWVPHQLLFLARGGKPFRLAYGSVAVERADSGFVALMEELKLARGGKPVIPEAATFAAMQSNLGGAARLAPPPPPLPWKKWLLWAALALAVAFVAGMALRLYKEMSVKAP
jgi:hypothetical protein